MRFELLLSSLAVGLSLAQTSYNNGLWTPSTTEYQEVTTSDYAEPTSYYQSWTTWTSMLVYGTVTVTITSTVPCPTTPTPVWVTTTQYTTVCSECQPVTTCYACEPVITTSYWYGYSTPTTSYWYGYSTPTPVTTAQQPVTTITSGTVVYVFMQSTAAAAGQVTTNGVVQIISSGSREDADLMKAGLAMAVAVLALVVI